MKCPIIVAGNKTRAVSSKDPSGECLKEECACWDKTQSCCNEISKTRALFALVDVLTDIRDKMPHAGQFTK